MAKLGAIDFTSQVYSKTAVDNLLRMKQDVLVFDDTPTAGSVNPVTSWGIKLYVDDSIAGLGKILNWCGSVPTYADLPTENVRPGDVYNVEEDGMNVAATLDDSNDIVWDPLGPSMDVYLTKEEAASTYLSKDDASSTYALKTTVEGISSALGGHLSDTSNPHLVTKVQVGLGNVDNTSDMDKPVSTAVQSALNLKANSADLAAVATSGSYNDLLDRPTIPVVNNASLTIQQQGVDKATFTANSDTDVIVNIVEVDPVFTSWKNAEKIAAGRSASAGAQSISIGLNATTGYSSVAIGKNAVASGNCDLAIGSGLDATQASATEASGSFSAAIGAQAKTTAKLAIQLGPGTNSEASSLQFRSTQIVNGSGKIVSSNLDSDLTPTANSANTVTSGGIKTELDKKQDQFVVLKYGVSTWAEFQEAYHKNAVIFCLNGSRMGIIGYVTATQVEFNYYRSIQRHTVSNQGDQFFVYKLDESNTWSAATRETMLRNVSGNGIETTVVEQVGLGTISYAVKPKTGGGIGVDANGVYVDLSSLSSVSTQIAAIKNGTAGGSDLVDVMSALLTALGA